MNMSDTSASVEMPACCHTGTWDRSAILVIHFAFANWCFQARFNTTENKQKTHVRPSLGLWSFSFQPAMILPWLGDCKPLPKMQNLFDVFFLKNAIDINFAPFFISKLFSTNGTRKAKLMSTCLFARPFEASRNRASPNTQLFCG